MAEAKAAAKKPKQKAAPKAAAKSAGTKTPAKKAASKQSKDPKTTKTGSGADAEFAVIETGGKQYLVAVGDIVDVELLGDHAEGDNIEFDKVLMVDDGKDATIGDPYIKGAKVTATYQGLKKGKKLSIIRFEAKSNRDRRVGHRQKYARVRIDALK